MLTINNTTQLNPKPIASKLTALEAKTPNTPQQTSQGQFADWLKHSLSGVDALQQKADAASQALINGENDDLHGTMVALQKADISLNLMMEVRNKIISAYEEIKRMQF